jgi:excisionase family DNA binding protein
MTSAARSDRLLTVREAARLTGLPKRTLRERIHRGQVAIRIVGKGRDARVRLTEPALVEAGLLRQLEHDAASPADGNVAALVELLREQNARLATIEEQRLQLAGQLGAALERVRSLEERVLQLAEPNPEEPRLDDVVERIHGPIVRTPTVVGTAKVGLGAATVGLAGAAVVRAVGAVSHRSPRHWSASLGSLVDRARSGRS